MSTPHDITQLLKDWSKGNKEAFDKVMPLVYGELRKLAASYLRGRPPERTIQTTELVHEVYMRLLDQHSVQWQSRAHFFGIAAMLMRRVLVSRARERQSGKRGGGSYKIALNDSIAAKNDNPINLISLDTALKLLAAKDERKGRMVELLFFGGLTIEEASNVLGISLATGKRDWLMAKAWLYREINRERSGEDRSMG